MPIFLFLRQFNCSDEISMDEDGLPFRSGACHLLWCEHIGTLHQGTDDFGAQFLDCVCSLTCARKESMLMRCTLALQ